MRLASLTVVALLAASGCHRVPLRFPENIPGAESASHDHPQVEHEQATTARLHSGSPDDVAEVTVPSLSEASAKRSAPGMPPGSPGRFVSANSPTPHLDAALARANFDEKTASADTPTPPPQPAATSSPTEPPPLVLPLTPATGLAPASETLDARHSLPPLEQAPSLRPEPPQAERGPDSAKKDDEVKPSSAPPASRAEIDPATAPFAPQLSPMAPPEPAQPPENGAGLSRAKDADTMPWPDLLAKLIERTKKDAGRSEEDRLTWETRLHLLQALASDTISEPEAALWTMALDLVKVSRTEPPDEAAIASELASAVDELERLAPFEVATFQLCRKVSGFGNYEPADSHRLRPGQPVIVYSELRGMTFERAEGEFRSRVGASVSLTRSGETDPAWSTRLATAEDTCRKRRRDYYVNYRIHLPADLAPGRYTLRLVSTDLLSGRDAAATLDVLLTR